MNKPYQTASRLRLLLLNVQVAVQAQSLLDLVAEILVRSLVSAASCNDTMRREKALRESATQKKYAVRTALI